MWALSLDLNVVRLGIPEIAGRRELSRVWAKRPFRVGRRTRGTEKETVLEDLRPNYIGAVGHVSIEEGGQVHWCERRRYAVLESKGCFKDDPLLDREPTKLIQ